ncbi:MAG: hypothetical protein HOP15_00010 [Planctomycetes bacterium]|nr:hypothetical protein [Planctomycetota bacterium]
MKFAVRIAIGLVLLLSLVLLGAVFFADALAKRAIERGGTYALGVETRLDGASLGLVSGEFALAGLAVANPPGFAQPNFFTLRSTELELPLNALMQDRITIPLLTLEGIGVDLERNASGTNYGVILDNLKRFETGEATAQEDGADGGTGKTFLLEKLVIRDVRAAVNLLPAGGDLTKLSLSIPEIVVEDLGSDMTLAEICALVVKTVIQAAIQAGSGLLPEEMLADLRSRMDDLEGSARVLLETELGNLDEKLQERAENLGPEAQKALKKAGAELGGKLDGLLKTKKD